MKEEKIILSVETHLPIQSTKQEDSVGERLKLAEKLRTLGKVDIDKRIYKK